MIIDLSDDDPPLHSDVCEASASPNVLRRFEQVLSARRCRLPTDLASDELVANDPDNPDHQVRIPPEKQSIVWSQPSLISQVRNRMSSLASPQNRPVVQKYPCLTDYSIEPLRKKPVPCSQPNCGRSLECSIAHPPQKPFTCSQPSGRPPITMANNLDNPGHQVKITPEKQPTAPQPGMSQLSVRSQCTNHMSLLASPRPKSLAQKRPGLADHSIEPSRKKLVPCAQSCWERLNNIPKLLPPSLNVSHP